MFGALDAKIYDPYQVFLEYTLNDRTHSQADLYVNHTSGGEDFLIEVKRAGQIANGNDVKRQVQKYHRDINQRYDLTLGKTFVCVISETWADKDENGSSDTTALSDELDVPSTLDDIEAEFDNLEVVVNQLGAQ